MTSDQRLRSQCVNSKNMGRLAASGHNPPPTEGVPQTAKILANWSTSFWPGNKTLPPRSNSAKMHPIDHTSILSSGNGYIYFRAYGNEYCQKAVRVLDTRV